MDTKKLNNRAFLCWLRDAANEQANISGMTPSWKRALLRLSDAADQMDAMWARTDVGNAVLEHDDPSDWWKDERLSS